MTLRKPNKQPAISHAPICRLFYPDRHTLAMASTASTKVRWMRLMVANTPARTSGHSSCTSAVDVRLQRTYKIRLLPAGVVPTCRGNLSCFFLHRSLSSLLSSARKRHHRVVQPSSNLRPERHAFLTMSCHRHRLFDSHLPSKDRRRWFMSWKSQGVAR
jgi:hypothetical protein